MATRSSILAWRIPMDRRAWGHKELGMTEWLSTKLVIVSIRLPWVLWVILANNWIWKFNWENPKLEVVVWRKSSLMELFPLAVHFGKPLRDTKAIQWRNGTLFHKCYCNHWDPYVNKWTAMLTSENSLAVQCRNLLSVPRAQNSIPGLGTKIIQPMQCGQINKIF